MIENDNGATCRGVRYVLEGSRLGGALLARRVPDRFPKRFLSARHGSGEWRDFLAGLDAWAAARTEAELSAALAGADACFQLFEDAAVSMMERASRDEGSRSEDDRRAPGADGAERIR